MLSINDIDIAWLAGFYEGEGSCHATANRGPRYYAQCNVSQKDPETLLRFQAITGVGHISGVEKDGCARLRVSRQQDCWDLLWSLYPHLSLRRREQIDTMFLKCGWVL